MGLNKKNYCVKCSKRWMKRNKNEIYYTTPQKGYSFLVELQTINDIHLKIFDFEDYLCNRKRNKKNCPFSVKKIKRRFHDNHYPHNKALLNVTYASTVSSDIVQLAFQHTLKLYKHRNEVALVENRPSKVKICERGKSLFHVLNDILCKECSMGRYADKHNLNKCYFCSYGYYQNKIGQIGCIQCPINYTTAHLGSIHNFQCILSNENGSPKKLEQFKDIPNFPYYIPYIILQTLICSLPVAFIYIFMKNDLEQYKKNLLFYNFNHNGENLEQTWKNEHGNLPTIYQEVDPNKMKRFSKILDLDESDPNVIEDKEVAQNFEVVTVDIEKQKPRLTQADINIEIEKYIRRYNRKRRTEIRNSLVVRSNDVPDEKTDGTDQKTNGMNNTLSGLENKKIPNFEQGNIITVQDNNGSLENTHLNSNPERKVKDIFKSIFPMLRRSVSPPGKQPITRRSTDKKNISRSTLKKSVSFTARRKKVNYKNIVSFNK